MHIRLLRYRVQLARLDILNRRRVFTGFPVAGLAVPATVLAQLTADERSQLATWLAFRHARLATPPGDAWPSGMPTTHQEWDAVVAHVCCHLAASAGASVTRLAFIRTRINHVCRLAGVDVLRRGRSGGRAA